MPNSRIAPTTLRALLAASLVLSGPGAGAALTSPALAFADEKSAQEHSQSATRAAALAQAQAEARLNGISGKTGAASSAGAQNTQKPAAR